MSKASEYAVAAQSIPPVPRWIRPSNAFGGAQVSQGGDLDLGSLTILPPEDAISLGRWILEVFE